MERERRGPVRLRPRNVEDAYGMQYLGPADHEGTVALVSWLSGLSGHDESKGAVDAPITAIWGTVTLHHRGGRSPETVHPKDWVVWEHGSARCVRPDQMKLVFAEVADPVASPVWVTPRVHRKPLMQALRFRVGMETATLAWAREVAPESTGLLFDPTSLALIRGGRPVEDGTWLVAWTNRGPSLIIPGGTDRMFAQDYEVVGSADLSLAAEAALGAEGVGRLATAHQHRWGLAPCVGPCWQRPLALLGDQPWPHRCPMCLICGEPRDPVVAMAPAKGPTKFVDPSVPPRCAHPSIAPLAWSESQGRGATRVTAFWCSACASEVVPR